MSVDDCTDARILIIDDEPANVLLIEKLLQKRGFSHLKSTTDSLQAESLFEEFRPDIILLDLQMPKLDGFGVLANLQRQIDPEDFLPVVVLTADARPETKLKALAAGAKDFLTKPFDHAEVIARLQNLLATRSLHKQVLAQKQSLEIRVGERTKQLRDTQIEVVQRLGRACEFRDDETGLHTQRVGDCAAKIAQALGCDADYVELIRQAAPLHDIGKVGIPDSILLKPGRLTPEEWAEMKTHTQIGAKILGGSPHELLNIAEEIALTHHERYDGTGYQGMAKSEIPLAGRIVAVADAFDALTHARPYKQAWPLVDALDELRSQKGRQFDPGVVDAFLSITDQ